MLNPVGSSSTPFQQVLAGASPVAAEVSFGDVLNDQRTEQADSEFRETFDQFVGQTLYGSLLKEMRKSEQGVAYLNGGHAEKVFRGQLDQVLVEKMTDASADTLTGPMFDLMMANRQR